MNLFRGDEREGFTFKCGLKLLPIGKHSRLLIVTEISECKFIWLRNVAREARAECVDESQRSQWIANNKS